MTDVLETCDGKGDEWDGQGDDWVSEYEFTDNEISNITDSEK